MKRSIVDISVEDEDSDEDWSPDDEESDDDDDGESSDEVYDDGDEEDDKSLLFAVRHYRDVLTGKKPPMSERSIGKLYGVGYKRIKRAHLSGRPESEFGKKGRKTKVGEAALEVLRMKIVEEEKDNKKVKRPMVKAMLQSMAARAGEQPISTSVMKKTLIDVGKRKRQKKNATSEEICEVINPRLIEGKHYDYCNEANLEAHHRGIGEIYEKYPILLQEPGRIVNLDERPVPINQTIQQSNKSGDKVRVFVTKKETEKDADIGKKGDQQAEAKGGKKAGKEAIEVETTSSNNQHITDYLVVGGDGSKYCRVHIVTGKWNDDNNRKHPLYDYPEWIDADTFTERNGCFCIATPNGYTTKDVFLLSLRSSHDYIRRKRYPTGPLLFVYDGAPQHYFDVDVAGLVAELSHGANTLIVKHFKHNTTIWTQPLDRQVYAHVNNMMRRILSNLDACASEKNHFIMNSVNPELDVHESTTKIIHATAMSRTYGLMEKPGEYSEKALLWVNDYCLRNVPAHIISRGFKLAGIYPYDFDNFLGTWQVSHARNKDSSAIASICRSLRAQSSNVKDGRASEDLLANRDGPVSPDGAGKEKQLQLKAHIDELREILASDEPIDLLYNKVVAKVIFTTTCHPAQVLVDEIRTGASHIKATLDREEEAKKMQKERRKEIKKFYGRADSDNTWYDPEMVLRAEIVYHQSIMDQTLEKGEKKIEECQIAIDQLLATIAEREQSDIGKKRGPLASTATELANKKKQMEEIKREMEEKNKEERKKIAEVEEKLKEYRKN